MLYMYYKFKARNWKNDDAIPFHFYRQFPSEYLADRYAMRVSFARNSPYTVVFQPGEEVYEKPAHVFKAH